MSTDIEHFYVQRSQPLAPLLPAHVEWDHDDDGEHVVEGDGWQLLVYDPEPAEPSEIPDDLRSALPGLGYRVDAAIEPINPPDEAWQLLDAVLDDVGSSLGGATYDIRSGGVVVWREGQRS